MNVSLEDNRALIAAMRERAPMAAEQGQLGAAALLIMGADALEHTHEIATAGWLDTEESES